MSGPGELPDGAASPTVPGLPDRIGPYRVLRPIARGGMAEVYEVEDRVSGQHLALKLLLQTGGALARFNREYEAMSRLNHPHIVRVYNYGVLGENPWLSMELVEGTPLQAYAKRLGRPGSPERTEEVARVAHDLALALDHIHVRGLVHRDLKSANVLVLPDGRIKLFDFGTARVSDPIEDITREGEFIGTFAYASPEQVKGQPVDGRSDLYSFGVLLYRLVTGKRPFESDHVGELARMHVSVEPPPPSRHCEVSPELERLLLDLLAKRPEDRPSTGAEVAQRLEAVVGRPLYLPGTLEIHESAERLVGREPQVRTLWSLLDAHADGVAPPGADRPADTALVVGLPGSGREKLLDAAEREIARRFWRSLTLTFGPEGDDLEAFADLLERLGDSFGSDPGDEVGQALARVASTGRSTSLSVAERVESLREAGAALVRQRVRLDAAPLVLLVKGLRHAGPVGMEALAGLRDALRGRSVAFLLLGELGEMDDRPGSLARARLGDALRVEVPPLSVREVALLVGALLHRRPPPAQVARRIWQASGGLPTYVEEVVRELVDAGLLRAKGQDASRLEWASREDLEVPVPSGARERLLDQLAALPADRRRCLEALSLCGGEATLQAIAGALRCRPGELVPAVEDLSGRGWLSVAKRRGQPYLRMRQALAEQVVLDQLHPCRRRVLQRLLIEQVVEEPAFVAQIRLLMEVGLEEQGLERARDWAVHHLSRDCPVTALEVLEVVVPRLDQARCDDELRARLHLLTATCLLLVRPTDAQTSRSLVKAEKLLAGRKEATAELRLTRARVQLAIGHYPNFRKELLAAWTPLEERGPSPLAGTVAQLLGAADLASGRVEDSAAWHGRARRIASQLGEPLLRAHADAGVAAWQLASGRLVEAEQTASAAIRVFEEAQDLRGLSEAVPVWVESARLQGRTSEALALLEAHLPTLRESEVPTFYVRLLLANAWVEVDLARLGRAQECVDELGATLRKGEHLDLRLQADLVWGRILLSSGLAGEAAHRLAQVRARAETAGLVVLAESARALEGEALWALGEARAALQAFGRAVRELAKAGDLPALAAACSAQARATSETVDPEVVFRPIQDWLDQEPAALHRMERMVASARHRRAARQDAPGAAEEVAAALEGLAGRLDPTDAAAIRLHPWSRHVRILRRALGEGGAPEGPP